MPKKKFESSHTLYIGNLSSTTFDNDLFKHFSSKGFKIASAKVMVDANTRKSRCFGYLNFYSAEEATRCLSELNNTVIDNR